LVHAEELKRLAATAEGAEQASDASAALAAWREALDLLPADATQHQVVSARIAALSRSLGRRACGREARIGVGKGAAGLGALGALLFKFKFALMFVLTKAKLLLFGLTKASTFFSMLLSAGLYWTMWGWKFAVGVVLFHLHPRDGSRAGAAALRHQGHGPDVHPRLRRREYV